MPQAFRGAIAPLGSTLIALIKNTTVAAVILGTTTPEAAGLLAIITENEGASLLTFFVFALGFVILTLPLGIYFTRLSRRLAVKR
jgi:glutamate transport system permease protein